MGPRCPDIRFRLVPRPHEAHAVSSVLRWPAGHSSLLITVRLVKPDSPLLSDRCYGVASVRPRAISPQRIPARGLNTD